MWQIVAGKLLQAVVAFGPLLWLTHKPDVLNRYLMGALVFLWLAFMFFLMPSVLFDWKSGPLEPVLNAAQMVGYSAVLVGFKVAIALPFLIGGLIGLALGWDFLTGAGVVVPLLIVGGFIQRILKRWKASRRGAA